MTDKKIHHCSFCDRHKDEVKKLIVGDSVAICSECIDLCNQLMIDEENNIPIEPEHFYNNKFTNFNDLFS